MLTDAQMTDVRRFLGYALAGTTMVIDQNQDVVYMTFGMVEMSLFTRLTTLSPTEESVLVTTYLTNLYMLENAIPKASCNLATDVAAVWTHNKNEVSDRFGLFDMWRRRLCSFIGIAPGPGLGDGGLTLLRG